MKYSKQVLEAMSEGWTKARIARFQRLVAQRAHKIVKRSKNDSLRNQAAILKEVSQAVRDSVSICDILAKPALLIEALEQPEEQRGGITITISPTPEARKRLDDDE